MLSQIIDKAQAEGSAVWLSTNAWISWFGIQYALVRLEKVVNLERTDNL